MNVYTVQRNDEMAIVTATVTDFLCPVWSLLLFSHVMRYAKKAYVCGEYRTFSLTQIDRPRNTIDE